MDVKDLAGVSEPAKKLIEVVSAGVGSLFRPRSMRNEADAKAYEIRVLAAAEADAQVMKSSGQAQADLERLRLIANVDPEIVARAKDRLLCREIQGQLNVEAVAENALKSLPAKVSEEPVAEDWRRKFFLEAENVCDSDLQILWGKVLAGETASPGSYSLRTLETLKHLSKAEAEAFRIACGLAFADGWMIKTTRSLESSFAAFGLTYSSILNLRDAGLLHEGDSHAKVFDTTENVAPVPVLVLINNGVLMQLSGQSLANLRIPALPFTRAGQELQNLIGHTPNMSYLHAAADFLRNKGLAVKKGIETDLGDGAAALSFEEDF